MSVKAWLIRFLLRQLDHNPDRVATSSSRSLPQQQGADPYMSRTSSHPLTAEDEEVVRSALLPDPAEAIDTLLLNLRPSDEKSDFSCIVQLDELNDDDVYIVRKTLAAGAALKMVLVDDDDADRHHVHRDFYKLLGRLRINIDVVDDTSVHLASRRDDDGDLEFSPSTKENILQILDRLDRADVVQVQLWRADDWVQVSKSETFVIECALQSNGAQLVKLEGTQLSHLFQVRPLVLYWVRTGKFPSRIATLASED